MDERMDKKLKRLRQEDYPATGREMADSDTSKGMTIDSDDTSKGIDKPLADMSHKVAGLVEAVKNAIPWLESGSIHTCHADCQRAPCVQRREIDSLQAERDRLQSLVSWLRDGLAHITNSDDDFAQAQHLMARIDRETP